VRLLGAIALGMAATALLVAACSAEQTATSIPTTSAAPTPTVSASAQTPVPTPATSGTSKTDEVLIQAARAYAVRVGIVLAPSAEAVVGDPDAGVRLRDAARGRPRPGLQRAR
jgi:hypothetical protein